VTAPGGELPVVEAASGRLGSPRHCTPEDGCITCGDVALPLTVVSVHGSDATCRDEEGNEEVVATELVGPVAPGDRLLVHARVAIEHLGGPP
jgi:hydrogenase expression/formation protein HypC